MRLVFLAVVVALAAVAGCHPTAKNPVGKDFGKKTGDVLCVLFGGLDRVISDSFEQRHIYGDDVVDLKTTVVCRDGSWITRSVTNTH